jgi:hypothetical protein
MHTEQKDGSGMAPGSEWAKSSWSCAVCLQRCRGCRAPAEFRRGAARPYPIIRSTPGGRSRIWGGLLGIYRKVTNQQAIMLQARNRVYPRALDSLQRARKNEVMRSMLRLLVVLLCSASLAAPPAWCCQVPTVIVGKNDAPAPLSCCGVKPQTAPEPIPTQSDPRNGCCAPNRPAAPVKCCCEVETPLPPKSAAKHAPDTLGLPLSLPLPVLAIGLSSTTEIVKNPLGPSIPLHVLHSIWLC